MPQAGRCEWPLPPKSRLGEAISLAQDTLQEERPLAPTWNLGSATGLCTHHPTPPRNWGHIHFKAGRELGNGPNPFKNMGTQKPQIRVCSGSPEGRWQVQARTSPTPQARPSCYPGPSGPSRLWVTAQSPFGTQARRAPSGTLGAGWAVDAPARLVTLQHPDL